jgi:DEAD/DEAH box helicase domain-containing protein
MIDNTSLLQVAQTAGAESTEEFSFPARPAKLLGIPDQLHPRVIASIRAQFPHGLYAHQAKAILAGLARRSVCVATPTASGKTLIFTSITLSRLLASPGSVALALYPAKALLRDQVRKWEAAAKSEGIEVGVIDGGVLVNQRAEILTRCKIVLMTPDVMHAWMMAKLDAPEVRKFLGSLEVLVLDEAHIYDGIFGTNMAYLLRRLRAVSGVQQFLASSATIGAPAEFLKRLTGLSFEIIGSEDDGASVAEKSVVLVRLPKRKASKYLLELIAICAAGKHGRFLIFADSRKRVEELAAEGQSSLDPKDEKAPNASGDAVSDAATDADEIEDVLYRKTRKRILPYRAGYEEEDREAIQNALTQGVLLGVVTTSALELGIDIGDIELVVMLGAPPSVKSFWQRAGRSGRATRGAVVLLDMDGQISAMGLQRYLERPHEPNWLYLENEYLQYANALCAAEEQQQTVKPLYSRDPFASLPTAFTELLENELEPRRSIPHDLYPLKQQASGGPHRAFPLRSSIEKSYQVTCRTSPGMGLGYLSYAQVLREAFPGAIYRYLARPYRVFQINHGRSEIVTAKTTGIARTNPLTQTAVFPQFNDQMYFIRRSEDTFVAECRLQVSERVIGFVEIFGQNKNEVRYGPGNKYSPKPLNRYIDTTGICFYFPTEELQREKLAKYISIAFCNLCSVQGRDIGWGTFQSQSSPLGQKPVKGFAIYDSAFGSLRLTKQIPDRFDEIVTEAMRVAAEEDAPQVVRDLSELSNRVVQLGAAQTNVAAGNVFEPGSDDGWVTVIAPDQPAICHDGQSHVNEEVTVLRYLYTPQGIRYTLQSDRKGVTWQVTAAMIHPQPGATQYEQYNINTGETRPKP